MQRESFAVAKTSSWKRNILCFLGSSSVPADQLHVSGTTRKEKHMTWTSVFGPVAPYSAAIVVHNRCNRPPMDPNPSHWFELGSIAHCRSPVARVHRKRNDPRVPIEVQQDACRIFKHKIGFPLPWYHHAYSIPETFNLCFYHFTPLTSYIYISSWYFLNVYK